MTASNSTRIRHTVVFKLNHANESEEERAFLIAAKKLSSIAGVRSEEHTSELQSLMRISYSVFCLKKKQSMIHSTLRYLICHSSIVHSIPIINSIDYTKQ